MSEQFHDREAYEAWKWEKQRRSTFGLPDPEETPPPPEKPWPALLFVLAVLGLHIALAMATYDSFSDPDALMRVGIPAGMTAVGLVGGVLIAALSGRRTLPVMGMAAGVVMLALIPVQLYDTIRLATEDWGRFVDPDGQFFAEFPLHPNWILEADPGGLTSVGEADETFLARRLLVTEEYRIMRTSGSDSELAGPARASLTMARGLKARLQDTGWEVQLIQDYTFPVGGGYQAVGEELRFSKEDRVGKARFFTVYDRVYAVAAVAGGTRSENVGRFVRSVTFSPGPGLIRPVELGDRYALDAVEPTFRSYLTLLKDGRVGEAHRYLPTPLQEVLSEKEHARWWRTQVPTYGTASFRVLSFDGKTDPARLIVQFGEDGARVPIMVTGSPSSPRLAPETLLKTHTKAVRTPSKIVDEASAP